MALSAYPKPSTSITTDQFRDLFRLLISTGSINNAALLPYADSSGLNVKVAPGFAVIDGVAFSSTAVESRTIAAGSGGSLSRVDTLVANLDFSATPIVSLAVIQGTPASTGAAPASLALSGSVVYRWPIAYIAVGPTASTITSNNVTDIRSFTSQDIGLWTTGLRPASPRQGTFGFNTTLNVLEFFNGTVWGPITPTALDAGVITTGTLNAARLPTTSVAKGGTGAIDAAGARSNLAITPGNIGAQVAGSYASSSHGHNYTDVTVDGGLNIISWVNENKLSAANPSANGTFTMNGTFTSNNQIFTSGQFRTTADLWADGGIRGDAGVRSSGVYNTNNTGRAVYVASDGTFGTGSSSERFKKKIADSDLDGSLALAVRVRSFVYDPKFIESDGSVQTGVIAEELVALGLERFVIFNDDGTTSGVHYDKLALLALAGLQSEAKRLDALEVRLAKLEQ